MPRNPVGVTVHSTVQPLVSTLAELCRKRGFSIARLASLSGMDEAKIWRWYAGRSTPDIDDLDACLEHVGMRLSIRPLPPRSAHLDLVYPALCCVRHGDDRSVV